MFRRHHLLVSASVALFTSVVAAGCSDNKQATPRVTFDSLVLPGSHPSTDCPEKNTWLTIGTFGNPAAVPPVPVHPVDDGADDQQGTVGISCSVVESNGAFDVKLHAELSGATGGAVTIVGLVNKGTDSPNITANFSASGRGTYSSPAGTGCVISFDAVAGHAIAGGRIWAKLNCPTVTQESLQRTCQATSEFRFENCSQ
jgi:hypothetical protein